MIKCRAETNSRFSWLEFSVLFSPFPRVLLPCPDTRQDKNHVSASSTVECPIPEVKLPSDVEIRVCDSNMQGGCSLLPWSSSHKDLMKLQQQQAYPFLVFSIFILKRGDEESIQIRYKLYLQRATHYCHISVGHYNPREIMAPPFTLIDRENSILYQIDHIALCLTNGSGLLSIINYVPLSMLLLSLL